MRSAARRVIPAADGSGLQPTEQHEVEADEAPGEARRERRLAWAAVLPALEHEEQAVVDALQLIRIT